jgi:outer membrane lipoprotein-sorting protein
MQRTFLFIIFILFFTTCNHAHSECNEFQMEEINSYLSSFVNLKASFEQVGQNGKASYGTFFMKRPNLMKLFYDRPNIELVYNKGQILFYDRELESFKKQKIHNFILRAILDGKIQNRNLICKSIFEEDKSIIVYLKAKYDVLTSSDMTITFSKNNQEKLQLSSIENKQKNEYTKIFFHNISHENLDQSAFEIQK